MPDAPPAAAAAPRWCLLFSGFLEREGQPRACGMQRLAGRLRRSGTALLWEIEYRGWRADAAGLAARIADEAAGGPPPRIVAAGYSWGAGWAAVNLAWELWARGLALDALLLADPVYRSRTWLGRWRSVLPPPWAPRGPRAPETPAWLGWLHLLAGALAADDYWPAPAIRLPPNVRRLYVWRQRQDLPMGHRVVAHPSTQIEREQFVADRGHRQMDDLPGLAAGVVYELERINAESRGVGMRDEG